MGDNDVEMEDVVANAEKSKGRGLAQVGSDLCLLSWVFVNFNLQRFPHSKPQ